MTVDGKQWGIPTTYSVLGYFYRKDIFEKLGIAVPKTWEEFVAAAKKLKENDIIPFTIGTKDVWTPAGWFDILNMRINGYDFHMQLMDGKVPYTDERVKEVFAKWKELGMANSTCQITPPTLGKRAFPSSCRARPR